MSDDKTKKFPQDAARISLSERWEVDYWTKALGISADKLRDAVEHAGPSAAAVRHYLGKK
jgi:hypothetical protein